MQLAIVQVQEETIDFTTISKIENVSKKIKTITQVSDLEL
jgi:hypothetical protein